MKKETVLVTGGAGFIGSHINKMLSGAGYNTVILDNLSRGDQRAVCRGEFVHGDIGDRAVLDRLFSTYGIDAVMHFAGFTDVGESVQDPYKYYQNNVSNTLILLEEMRRNNIKYFIFSSSAAIFGLPQQPYINETHPCLPINPYGDTKLMAEHLLRDASYAYDLKYSCLRYFNAAGGDPEGEIKNFKVRENNLIPLTLRSLLNPEGKITIFGTDYPTVDGTCIRDYIHVHDLGRAHLAALERLFAGEVSDNYNLGNGQGFSVRQVITAVEKVTHLKLQLVEGSRRPGDPPVLVADASKARKELNWNPQYPDLETMIAHAWQALQH